MVKNTIIIQEEIKVSQDWIDKVIKHYENVSESFGIGFGEFTGDKHDIIREIKNLTKVGKEILLMDYKFKQWLDENPELKEKVDKLK